MNEHKLEARLRLLFEASTVRFRKLKRAYAQITMDAGTSTITLPLGYDDDFTLRLLLHELSHKAMVAELAALGDFEEDFINRVIEPRMMLWLSHRKKSLAWWLRRLKQARDNA